MADLLESMDDEFWEHLNIKNKKRAESKEQQLKSLLSRIDELQAQNQQLQEGAAATAGLKSQLASAKSQLQDARKQHQQEVEVLKQQLQDAHRKLQRTQSSSLNNAADSEALRQQATTSQAAADAAQAELAQLRQKHSQVAVQAEKAEKEKQLLLTNLQSLIKLNAELQAALTKERQQRGAQGASVKPDGQEPSTSTPPQSSARLAAPAGAASAARPTASSSQPGQQPQQAHRQAHQQQPEQPSVPNHKRKQEGAGTGSKKSKKGAASAEATRAAAQEAAERNAAAATAAAQRAAEELKRIQERQKQRQEQEQKAAAAARKRQQQAALRKAAEERKRKKDETQRRAQERLRQQQEALRKAAEEAEKQRHAAAQEQLRQQAAAAEACAQQIAYDAPQPELEGLSAGGLKDFLKQAGVDAAAMRGVLEKSDLLRVAKAHMQLWECRRIVLCGELAAADEQMRLYAAVCVFRITHGPAQDLGSAVRAVKDSLKRTRQRLSLLVHPDKATNELSCHKGVFEEAFKVLTSAHEVLAAAADGKYEGSTAGPQQQQQQAYAGPGYGYAGAAGGPTGFAGFAPGGFPAWGFAGFPPGSFNMGGFPAGFWCA